MASDEDPSPVRELAVSQIDLNLHAAVKRNDVSAVQKNIQNGANVNCVHSETDTSPLVEACQQGYDAIVRILLDAGADARQKIGEFGETAVIHACHEGNLSIVKMLINHDNYLIEIVDNYGQTPLHFAIRTGRGDIVRFLFDRGANVLATTTSGHTTLMSACPGIGDLEIMGLLVAAGVDVEARNTNQRTALHYAALHGRLEVVQELVLQHSADMGALNCNQHTPFDDALHFRSYNYAVLDSLLEMYGNRLTQDHGRRAFHAILRAAKYSYHRGKLPIHIACQTKAPVDVLSMLGKLDLATLHMADHRGNLALHECCHGARVDHSCVLFLVEQGGVGTLAARNRQGASPLHVLCGSTKPSWRTVQYLIQSFPGSVEGRTNTGQYPFMIAANETSTASLSVIYEVIRARPDVVVPRQIIKG